MKRVLIVDDERDLVESLAMALETDYEVHTAFDGKQALELLERGPGTIDAVVLDLMMPVMNGEELLAELRARGLEVPVIVASASRDLARKCTEIGVAHFVQKPYRLGALLARLAEITGEPRA